MTAPSGRRGSFAAAALGSASLVTALVLLAGVLSLGCIGVGVATAVAAGPRRCAVIGQPASPRPTPLPPSEPVAITVEAIDACSTLVPVGVDGQRRIEVPSLRTPMQAGWYRWGPTPGQKGPAIVVGHINGAGQEGVFADLDEVGVGDRVTVLRRDGTTAFFAVTATERAPKSAFPTSRVYGRTDDAQLRLITCGGALDRSRHDYADNVIVFATLVGRG